MNKNEEEITILIVEDDDDDYLLTKKAFQDSSFTGALHRVKNGDELMTLLRNSSRQTPLDRKKLLLILDLNMPCKDGREALKEIKAHSNFRMIPVIVLTTSNAKADIEMTYELGASSFISKPTSFEDFAASIQLLKKYWTEVVQLPCLQDAL